MCISCIPRGKQNAKLVLSQSCAHGSGSSVLHFPIQCGGILNGKFNAINYAAFVNNSNTFVSAIYPSVLAIMPPGITNERTRDCPIFLCYHMMYVTLAIPMPSMKL